MVIITEIMKHISAVDYFIVLFMETQNKNRNRR